MSEKHYLIEETVVEGKRLGRHVNHDERSKLYALAESEPLTTRWERVIGILDQGSVGACTGFACTGHLGTQPDDGDLAAAGVTVVLDNAEGLTLYSAAEVIDGDGPYPPQDNGSSGLSVAQAAKNAGLCSGYVHAFSIAACHTAIQTGPFMLGTNWYTSFDSPDANGVIAIEPGATVRGGHEYECIGYDAGRDLWECVNSWGESYGLAGHFFINSATLTTLLAGDGDATQLVPLSKPAPTPTPAPQPKPPTPTPPSPPPPAPPSESGAVAAIEAWYAAAKAWWDGHVGTARYCPSCGSQVAVHGHDDNCVFANKEPA
jgi:hypothetical protein